MNAGPTAVLSITLLGHISSLTITRYLTFEAIGDVSLYQQDTYLLGYYTIDEAESLAVVEITFIALFPLVLQGQVKRRKGEENHIADEYAT